MVAERGPVRIMNRPEPGFWMVRCCRHCAEVAARIWLCDHEPGNPENTVDQPYLQGQIGLGLVPPEDVWRRRGRPIDGDEFAYQIRWLRWAETNAPGDPRFLYRRPINRDAVPIPRFQRSA